MKEDPLFGQLNFAARNPSGSFWEGRGCFKPTGIEVAYLIKAGDAGPGESHRAVYQKIERRFGELLLVVTPLLHREHAAHVAGSEVSLSQPKFSLDIVHISEVESESEWGLDFSCDNWEDALFAVHMKGWQPTGKISVMD